MGIRLEKNVSEWLVFLIMAVMVVGLFFSRALLSVSIAVFFLFTILFFDLKAQCRSFVKEPMLWGMCLLFFLPFLSGLWSANTTEWLSLVRIKLPLFLLPFAFASDCKLSEQKFNLLLITFLFFLTCGCGWSILQYLNNPALINKSYLSAKLIPTPLENDHVRFSWLVVVGILSAVLLYFKLTKRSLKIALVIIAVFLSFYIHLLSARTGILSFYFSIVIALFFIKDALRKKQYIILWIFIFVLIPAIAWFTLPTLRNRFYYNRYDYTYFSKGQYLAGSNDGSRITSLKAGRFILFHHPLGVGAGDILDSTKNWYKKNIPSMPESDMIYPASEWMMYGASNGWAGFLLISWITFYPLFVFKTKNRVDLFFRIAFNSTVILLLLFDIGLETQIGVFSYAFFVLLFNQYKLFNQQIRQ